MNDPLTFLSTMGDQRDRRNHSVELTACTIVAGMSSVDNVARLSNCRTTDYNRMLINRNFFYRAISNRSGNPTLSFIGWFFGLWCCSVASIAGSNDRDPTAELARRR